jgi:hypothetical protein
LLRKPTRPFAWQAAPAFAWTMAAAHVGAAPLVPPMMPGTGLEETLSSW